MTNNSLYDMLDGLLKYAEKAYAIGSVKLFTDYIEVHLNGPKKTYLIQLLNSADNNKDIEILKFKITEEEAAKITFTSEELEDLESIEPKIIKEKDEYYLTIKNILYEQRNLLSDEAEKSYWS